MILRQSQSKPCLPGDFLMKTRSTVFLAIILVGCCYAREAKVFMLKASNAPEIRSDRGHLNLVFVAGWVANKDSLVNRIFSRATKLSAQAEAVGTYFDQDQLKNSWIIENTDVSHTLNRPWGAANKTLLASIPADTAIVSFTLKMAAYKEETFRKLINSFKSSEPGTGIAVEPYLTYATVADGLFSTLFGTDKTTYPFLLDTGISDNSVMSSAGFYEHYIISIAPNSDNDPWFNALDGSKLSYASNDLKYDGQSVKDHTFAIVFVGTAEAPDIPKLLLQSRAAWAVLALTNFYSAGLPDIGSKDDVPKQDKTMKQQLAACIDQLMRELRFSAYDRAKGLTAFSDQAKKSISDACAAKNIAVSDCKTPQIDAFKDGINGIFGVSDPQTKKDVAIGAKEVNAQLYQLLNLK
jgi:hypothetical protein